MADPWLAKDYPAALQVVNGSYYSLENRLADWNIDQESEMATYPIMDDEYPTVVPVKRRAELALSGIIAGVGDQAANLVEDVGENDRYAARFWFCHPDKQVCGPAGYIKLKRASVVNRDGVLAVDGPALGEGEADIFDRWQYGRMLWPDYMTLNANKTPASDMNPESGQWVAVEVISAGNCSSLRVRYTKSIVNYDYVVPASGGTITPGLYFGQLKTTGEVAVPISALTGGVWRINTTPSNPTAKFRIGLLGKDW